MLQCAPRRLPVTEGPASLTYAPKSLKPGCPRESPASVRRQPAPDPSGSLGVASGWPQGSLRVASGWLRGAYRLATTWPEGGLRARPEGRSSRRLVAVRRCAASPPVNVTALVRPRRPPRHWATLPRLWCGCGGALVWLWGGCGVALGWPWGGFRVPL